MKVKLDPRIVALYNENDIGIEASLDWLLGYIHKELSIQIPRDLITQEPHEITVVEISNNVIDRLGKKFQCDGNESGIINFLCLAAFALGGVE